MVHMTRNIIYKWYKWYTIDNLKYQTKTIHSIVLLYCIMAGPFYIVNFDPFLMYDKKKLKNINKVWSKCMNLLISPLSQVRGTKYTI